MTIGIEDTYRGTVTTVDTASKKVVGSPIKAGAFPMYLAPTPDGHYLYVSDEADNTVSVVDSSE